MSLDILVPSLGESVTEATVARWLKKPGDAVAVDEPLVELETDKVSLEVPAPVAGRLAEIVAADGADVAVGAVLGRLETVAAAGAALAKASPADADAAPRQRSVSEVGSNDADRLATGHTAAAPDGPPTAPAPSAPMAPEAGDQQADPGARATGPGTPSAASTASAASKAPTEPEPAPRGVGPAARKLADEAGLALAAVPATGPKGNVTKGDVQAAAARPVEPAAVKPEAIEPKAEPATTAGPVAAPPSPPSGGAALPASSILPAREERVRMTRLRKRIAERLKTAQATAAMLTTFNEVDMSAVMRLRATYQEAFTKRHGVKLGFMGFFVRATVEALRSFPVVNAEIDGDEIVYKHHVDIGVAVSTEQGLVVPVLRDADAMTLAGVEKSIGDLGRRAREGKLTMADLAGGTFTITNGGVFGSLLSTPILNPPQVGILGMHKIQERAVVVGGAVVARPMMYLALSYDHRLVDGREAVGFLVRIKESLEEPERLLLDL